jgi:hypothetical protein
MELKEIKRLLDKYYDGDTSLEEEHLLRDFFRNSEVPEDMFIDKELFVQMEREQNKIPENKELTHSLHQIIDLQVKRENKIKRLNLFYKVSSVAAGIAIIVISYLAVVQNNKKTLENDTYQDPKVAYEQVKRTLLYISQNLNHGTETLNQVSRINEGMMEFSTFSSFSSGLKDLELIGKYYNEQNDTHSKNK